MIFLPRRWPLRLTLIATLLLLSPLGCAAESELAPIAPPPSSEAATLSALRLADVVYLGEQHDRPADHTAQLDIIQRLHGENADLAIGLEMFQRPFQPVLDRYLAGEITEAELIEQTEYEERWGFPWEFYAPLLRFARAQALPVIALNAPSEVTRQIAREGLASLGPEDFRYLPPRAEIDTSNRAYQDLVTSDFEAHGSHGNLDFDNFFAAQVTWDETMALAIADFKTQNPDTQVIVIAGSGHVAYGYGIPDRVARRLGADLTQYIVLLNPDADAEAEAAISDGFWYSE